MKLILLCLVVVAVSAKPKGSNKLADAAQKETDKAVEEARHALKRMQLIRQEASSMDMDMPLPDIDSDHQTKGQRSLFYPPYE